MVTIIRVFHVTIRPQVAITGQALSAFSNVEAITIRTACYSEREASETTGKIWKQTCLTASEALALPHSCHKLLRGRGQCKRYAAEVFGHGVNPVYCPHTSAPTRVPPHE